jgi:hypothetical protein
MKKRYLLLLFALTLVFGFGGHSINLAEDELPRPTDIEPFLYEIKPLKNALSMFLY